MIKHALVAVALCSSAGPAIATTLNYYGQYYTEAEGSGPEYAWGFNGESANYVFTDGYTKGMRVELSFELDKPLAANEIYGHDYRIDWYYSNPLEFSSFSVSDGLYTRTDEQPGFSDLTIDGWIMTDDFGHVSAWDILVNNGCCVDADEFGTSSENGDYASHVREYMTFDPVYEFREVAVASTASTPSRGVWAYTEAPTPVPVPASLPLVLSGIGLFALVRRRRRRS